MALKPIETAVPAAQAETTNRAPTPAASSAERLRRGASSAAKLAANRANAQHSTGPRTPEGKAVSSQNALKHGLFSRSLSGSAVRLGEDRGEFDALLGDLLARYQPQGREEELMVDCLATLWWRRMRLITHAQAELSDCLKGGNVPVYALKKAEFIGPEEGRLQRAIERMHKDLAFLQRYRDDRQQEAERRAGDELDAFVARYHAETEEIIRQGSALGRRRRAEEDLTREDETSCAVEAPAAGDELDSSADGLSDGEPAEEPGEEESLAAAALLAEAGGLPLAADRPPAASAT